MAWLIVIWELKLTYVSETSCMLTSNVKVETADVEFQSIMQNPHSSDADLLQNHFIDETPFFAADIERKARMGIFG